MFTNEFLRYSQVIPRLHALPLDNHVNHAAGKTKMVAWMVSHCETTVQREM